RFYNGRAIAQQGMGTAVPAAKHIAGYGQHVASLLERTSRGDERAALLSRFDDDDGASQAADDAVAEGKEPAPRLCARHQLGRDAAAHFYFSSERRVLGRVDDIDSRSEDADRASAGLERAAVRGRIDTPSQAADDSQPGGREIAGQLLRHIERVRRRAAAGPQRRATMSMVSAKERQSSASRSSTASGGCPTVKRQGGRDRRAYIRGGPTSLMHYRTGSDRDS